MNSDGIIWSALATINAINLVFYIRRISKEGEISTIDLLFTLLSASGLMTSAWMIATGL